MESSRRIAWVDYAKGIAIIGVFILHSNAPEDVIHVVDAFCMPLFFLLSGFVFSIRRYSSFGPFLWNKLRTLIFPGIFFAVVPFVIERAIGMFSGNAWTAKAYAEWILGIAVNLRGHEGFGSIPWFLACLFILEIGGYILLRLSKCVSLPEWAFIVIGTVSILIGYLYSAFIHIVLPWGTDIALSMFGFFVFGYVMRGHRETLEHVMRPSHHHHCGGAAGDRNHAECTTSGQRIHEHVRQHRLLPSRGVCWYVDRPRNMHRLGTCLFPQLPSYGTHLLRTQYPSVLLRERAHLWQHNPIHLETDWARYQWRFSDKSTVMHARDDCHQSNHLLCCSGNHEPLAAWSAWQKTRDQILRGTMKRTTSRFVPVPERI